MTETQAEALKNASGVGGFLCRHTVGHRDGGLSIPPNQLESRRKALRPGSPVMRETAGNGPCFLHDLSAVVRHVGCLSSGYMKMYLATCSTSTFLV